MKWWQIFVLMTVACWGAYVPVLHQGQQTFGKNGALRAFLFVGMAYFLAAGFVLALLIFKKAEPLELNWTGVNFSTLAGVLGAAGALGIAFALKNEGTPLVVAPLVFAGAPIVNTLVSLSWHRPQSPPNLWFFAGILLAAVGAAMVLANKPR